MKFSKWMRGYYRLSDETRFAGIRRHRDGWHVEIRDSDTGTLRRYAGIWPTLRSAKAEAEHVLSPTPLIELFTAELKRSQGDWRDPDVVWCADELTDEETP